MLTIDNPPVNALSHRMRQQTFDALTAAIDDPEVNAIVLVCAGRTFIAGADISEFGTPLEPPTPQAMIDVIEQASPKPVVAAIHGTALGGGLEIALACHYRVALESARFGLPEVSLGIIPGAGGTQRLSRLVGPSKAKDLCFTGRFVDAEEALRIGLVDQVVPAAEVYDAARAWAGQFANGPAFALRAAKEAIDAGLSVDLETGLQIERQQFAALFATEDRGIGMTSFVEKGPGKAEFVGR
jgi:enoyl-CoA hydratase